MIINKTPHELNFVINGKEVSLPKSDNPARIILSRTPAGTVSIDGMQIPVNDTMIISKENFPPVGDGNFYIVSRAVFEASIHTYNLMVPGELIRDDGGRVIGCKSLER